MRLVLREKNLDFTLKTEKVWERRPEFLALNPAGEVPVLIEPDGDRGRRHEAIVEYLDEVYPEKMLIGVNPVERAEIRRLIAWFDVKMNFEVTENLLGEKMMKRYRSGPASAQPNSPAIRAGHANLPYHLDYIGYLVERRRWLAGDHFSSPTLPPQHTCRASTISATCRGTRTTGQGMVRAHQVAPELPPDPGRPRPRRPAAQALRRSRFLKADGRRWKIPTGSTDTPRTRPSRRR